MAKVKLTKPQQDAVNFINQMRGVSIQNPYPVHRTTIKHLIDKGILKESHVKMDYILRTFGKTFVTH